MQLAIRGALSFARQGNFLSLFIAAPINPKIKACTHGSQTKLIRNAKLTANDIGKLNTTSIEKCPGNFQVPGVRQSKASQSIVNLSIKPPCDVSTDLMIYKTMTFLTCHAS